MFWSSCLSCLWVGPKALISSSTSQVSSVKWVCSLHPWCQLMVKGPPIPVDNPLIKWTPLDQTLYLLFGAQKLSLRPGHFRNVCIYIDIHYLDQNDIYCWTGTGMILITPRKEVRHHLFMIKSQIPHTYMNPIVAIIFLTNLSSQEKFKTVSLMIQLRKQNFHVRE